MVCDSVQLLVCDKAASESHLTSPAHRKRYASHMAHLSIVEQAEWAEAETERKTGTMHLKPICDSLELSRNMYAR